MVILLCGLQLYFSEIIVGAAYIKVHSIVYCAIVPMHPSDWNTLGTLRKKDL